MIYFEPFWNRCVRRCLNFTFWKYHGWTLRNKKVIRSQTPGSMDRKFGKSWNFRNIDAGEGFVLLKSRNSLAGAISMPCGAPTYHSKWLVEWLHRRVISSTGTIARRKVVVQSRRFRTLAMIFVAINDVFWNIWRSLCRRCLIFISWKYHGWALRNEKVIRAQATGPMSLKFGNHEIFKNIDAGEGLTPIKSRNSLAGAISMPCGAPTYHLHDSYSGYTRKVISSTGAIAPRKVVV